MQQAIGASSGQSAPAQTEQATKAKEVAAAAAKAEKDAAAAQAKREAAAVAVQTAAAVKAEKDAAAAQAMREAAAAAAEKRAATSRVEREATQQAAAARAQKAAEATRKAEATEVKLAVSAAVTPAVGDTEEQEALRAAIALSVQVDEPAVTPAVPVLSVPFPVRVEALELAVFHESPTNLALLLRVKRLEQELFGTAQAGHLIGRLDSLEKAASLLPQCQGAEAEARKDNTTIQSPAITQKGPTAAFRVNDWVVYSTTQELVRVLQTHLDDPSAVYYTISINGREKQTTENRLELPKESHLLKQLSAGELTRLQQQSKERVGVVGARCKPAPLQKSVGTMLALQASKVLCLHHSLQ